MILSNEDMTLKPEDEIIEAEHCALVVLRVVELHVCRCRECEDKCERLGDPPHLCCVICSNNHSQAVDGVYKGPFRGRVRGAGE